MSFHLFSHRHGLKSSEKLAQVESVDMDLRTALWNAFDIVVLRSYRSFSPYSKATRQSNLGYFFDFLWQFYFKRPIDTVPPLFERAVASVRQHVFECAWNELYDFLEATRSILPDDRAELFEGHCNAALEREFSGYRFLGGSIVPVTSSVEVDAVEAALAITRGVTGVHAHLEAALRLLAIRPHADLRNSIKESICAVEAVAQLVTGEHGATLGRVLDRLDDSAPLHPALKQALSKLYGYTSDADGIRHAMMDAPKLSSADARFMLVACAAFVSYVLAKAADEGSGPTDAV